MKKTLTVKYIKWI